MAGDFCAWLFVGACGGDWMPLDVRRAGTKHRQGGLFASAWSAHARRLFLVAYQFRRQIRPGNMR